MVIGHAMNYWFPVDGNELTVRLYRFWSANWWLLV